MAKTLEDARFSLEHARAHIDALKAAVLKFSNSAQFEQVIERNSAGHDVHKLKLRERIPRLVSGVTFDVVIHLRSALDQAANQIGVAAGGKSHLAKFPFGKTLDDVNARFKPKAASSALPKSVQELIVAVGPHKNGNLFLWSLNELCNLQKHEIVIPMALSVSTGSVDSAFFSGVIEFSFPPRWDVAREEMKLVVVPHNAPFDFKGKIETQVVTSHIEGIGNHAIVPVLEKIADIVEDTISKMEVEANALGFLKP